MQGRLSVPLSMQHHQDMRGVWVGEADAAVFLLRCSSARIITGLKSAVAVQMKCQISVPQKTWSVFKAILI